MKIKLSNGNSYSVVDIAKTDTTLTASVIFDGTATFETIESDFISYSDTLYKLDDEGETIQSYTGYTVYKGAKKDPDAVIAESVVNSGTDENPVYEREITYGTVLYVYMAQPDIEQTVSDLQTDVATLNSLVIEPEPVTFEEKQTAKKKEVGEACTATISAGTDVTLSDGTVEHFSATSDDQSNLTAIQIMLANGATQYEYHADGQPCRYYSAADLQLIITAVMALIAYNTTYCNSLNMWIIALTEDDLETLESIYYGIEIPEEYQSEVLKAYLNADT